MIHFPLVQLLIFYGIFLILCGIISVIFIGLKAKTALASGGISGLMALLIAYFVSVHAHGSKWAGIALALLLVIVFSWRATKTLHKIFELIPAKDTELKRKGIAFLIISLMAIVSFFVFMLQVIYLV